MSEQGDQNSSEIASRIASAVFGITFGGVGLTVLTFMWASPFGEFGSPPLFFRFFASFIALPFVGIGIAALISAITGKTIGTHAKAQQMHQQIHDRIKSEHQKSEAATINRDQCPNCSAPRGNAEISPSGDVKCDHCQAWYNVYR